MAKVQLNDTGRVLIQRTVFKGKDYLSVAKQFLADDGEYRFKNNILIPADKIEEFKKAVGEIE